MMSQQSKRELLEVLRPRYLKASKVKKQRMLDEFTAVTGYRRKYAIRVLKHPVQRIRRKRAGRKAIYRGAVVEKLKQIWEIYGRICSKRLHPFLPEAIQILERCGEIELAPETKQLLLSISRSTIDRCLRPVRVKSPHGLGTTKPGTLLKKAIPVRTFADWNEDRPGFMEIDLVAHCGETTEGQYLNTLTCTDICTGWTEPIALPRRTQQAVCTAIQAMRQDLPFALLGIDSDNGSEFMKHFDTAVREACNDHWHTYPKTPKMNAHCERFNRTIQEEFVDYHTPLLLDPPSFNLKLADYLIWYNGQRPHHSLKLKSPVQFLQSNHQECNLWWPNTRS